MSMVEIVSLISEDESIDSALLDLILLLLVLKLLIKAKKESSDEKCSTYGSEDEEYAMAVRDFKKFFTRRENVQNHRMTRTKELLSEALGAITMKKMMRRSKMKRFLWIMHQVRMSLKIITKNKRLKATRYGLEKELRELKDKLSILEKNKGVDLDCAKCHALKIENEKLKEESTRLNKFEKSTHCLNEMLSNQKPFGDNLGLGFNSFEASSSGTKEIKFVKAQKKTFSDREPDEWIKDSECSKHMTGNQKLFSTYKAYNRGNIICGSNLRGNIIGKGTTHLGLWYPKGTDIETVVYDDSDHAGDYVDRKSTSGICTFMGYCLTSWFSKKQTALTISTTKVEYVSTGKACQQAPWIKQALIDYDVRLDDVPIMCDNKDAIDLSKNPVQQSRTKHIEIRRHFLRDNVQKGHISIEKVSSIENIADILTKPFKRKSFNYLRLGLGMMEQIPWSLDELVYGAPSEGPYQTNIRSPDDIISFIRKDQEGQVTRICHQEEVEQTRLILPYGMLLTRLFDFIIDENPELQNESNVLYDRVMNPLAAQLEQKPRKDHGTRRGRYSTSSSTFNEPSSSHFNDDDDDGNNEGTSRAITPSPIRYVNSLTNQVLQLFQNPPNIDPHLEPFYTRQTEIINRQVQLQDE
nr:copia protein [Tanacetum cinerariifolium]